MRDEMNVLLLCPWVLDDGLPRINLQRQHLMCIWSQCCQWHSSIENRKVLWMALPRFVLRKVFGTRMITTISANVAIFTIWLLFYVHFILHYFYFQAVSCSIYQFIKYGTQTHGCVQLLVSVASRLVIRMWVSSAGIP